MSATKIAAVVMSTQEVATQVIQAILIVQNVQVAALQVTEWYALLVQTLAILVLVLRLTLLQNVQAEAVATALQ